MVIGRDAEQALFKRMVNSGKAEFLAVYGRRRVGKTYLIRQCFTKSGVYIEVTGTKDAPMSHQLQHFTQVLREVFHDPDLSVAANWNEAFTQLRKKLTTIPSDKRIVLFFDELPWLATPRSNFLPELEHLWNRYLSQDNRIIVVVCGSAAAWMIHHIIDNKGGLYGRLSYEMKLNPFTLQETEQYFREKQINLDRKQIVEIYFALGGIPKYLEYVKPGLSSAQIIQELFFSANGPMINEFHRLFASLFDDFAVHIKIVEALSEQRGGLPLEKLLKKVALNSGGSSTKYLRELTESGFITFVPEYHKKRKGGRYVLCDEYSLFYLHWVKGKTASHNDQYWLRQHQSAAFRSWAGLAFEAVCMKHLRQIFSALNIAVVVESASQWSSKDAQIDLVIERADRCIHLCEIKFYNDEVQVTQEFAKQLNKRRELFRTTTDTKKTIFNTLISCYGAEHNQHFLAAIDQELTLEQLFDL